MKKIFTLIILFQTILLLAINTETQAGLSGTYTIGGASPDYNNFTAAVSALNSQGVSGPVTFLVRAGTYDEQISITQFSGASVTNTVVFQSQDNDSTLVILTYPSSSVAADNYTLKLDDADYVIFKRITIQRTGSNSFAQVIDVSNGATHNQFLNNCIIGVTTASPSLNYALVSSSNSAFDDNYSSFVNNSFQNGSYGINFPGQGSSMLEQGTVISGNEFSNQYAYAVSCFYQDSLYISGNIITTASVNTNFCGIYAFYCDNSLRILTNKISLSSGGTGIYLYYCDGISSQRGLTANNFVAIGGATACSGIYVNLSSTQNIYYNSVNIYNTNSTSKAISIAGLVTANLDIRNNALAATGDGYAIYVDQNSITSIPQSDYNDLFTSGSNIGYWGNSGNQTNLANWQLTTSLDNNSITANPMFASNTDLHSSSGMLNAHAISLTSASTPVFTDIDGQTRNALTPDIGADEFSIEDLGVSSIVAPGNLCRLTLGNVQVYIKNYSSYTFSGFIPVSYQISGNSVVNGNTGNIVIPEGDSILFIFPSEIFATAGNLYINASTNLSVDINNSNDSLSGHAFTIYQLPPADAGPNQHICLGDAAILTASGGILYSWNNADDTPTIYVSPTSETIYHVTVTDTNGCKNVDSVIVFVDTIPAPVAFFG
ncbi:MAG: hypothetical protein WC599_09935, partial [Bacteroidales bacterium]